MRDNTSRKIGLQRPLGLLLLLQSRCQHLAPRRRAHCCSGIRKAQHPVHSLGLRQCRLLRLSCRLGLWLFRLWRVARPWIRHHLHRQTRTPDPALTSEQIADQILSAAVHRHRLQDPPSLRLQLLHGHADLVPLPWTPPDARTPCSSSTHISMPNWIHSWHCANLVWSIPACTRCVTF